MTRLQRVLRWLKRRDGRAARANLKSQAQREREANREVRRTMKECIKPENVIDDDVKECIDGYGNEQVRNTHADVIDALKS
ncbi:hypothetical protein NA644_19820 [Pseudomonas stutzeri]|uniref:hypothetical protein n=1 Tax=Stutzerimonas stutzeri TaxID=316 RepID=UPI00210879F1|nr:hypothetical protein [Stutzerimonas stutzeri]MCQ4251562.1 hypothetical protein [Stutzerimonas stutzeri]